MNMNIYESIALLVCSSILLSVAIDETVRMIMRWRENV